MESIYFRSTESFCAKNLEFPAIASKNLINLKAFKTISKNLFWSFVLLFSMYQLIFETLLTFKIVNICSVATYFKNI